MPHADLWHTFFDARRVIEKLGVHTSTKHVVEFGCGYGTFTIPAAQIIRGKITAFDLDEPMIEHTKTAAARAQVNNIDYFLADFFNAADLLGEACADYVMLFNILHGEKPQSLLAQAHYLLEPGGNAGIIHWNYDPDTPRGPPMAIRPRPEALAEIATKEGFEVSDRIELPPYHYGFKLAKPRD